MKLKTPIFGLFIAVAIYVWVKRGFKLFSGYQQKAAGTEIDHLDLDFVPTFLEADPTAPHYHVKLIIPRHRVSKVPVYIYFSDSKAENMDDVAPFLHTLAAEVGLAVFVFDFDASEEEKLDFLENFAGWSIIKSGIFDCNFNKVIIGGHGIGAIVSQFMGMQLKNDYKYTPGFSMQLVLNPKIYNVELDKSAKIIKKFDQKSLIQNYNDESVHREKRLRDGEVYGYFKSIYLVTEDFEGMEKVEKFSELLREEERDVTVVKVKKFDESIFSVIDLKKIINDDIIPN